MWTVKSADGKWRGRGLELGRLGESAVGPGDVTGWPPVDLEVREREMGSIQRETGSLMPEWTR